MIDSHDWHSSEVECRMLVTLPLKHRTELASPANEHLAFGFELNVREGFSKDIGPLKFPINFLHSDGVFSELLAEPVILYCYASGLWGVPRWLSHS